MGKEILKTMDGNNDGSISSEELESAAKIQELEERIRKSESQERMAWVSLIGILVFTGFLFSPWLDVDRVNSIGEFIGMFYISLAGILATFMGTQAWTMRK